MDCPRCGFNNLEESTFCTECGFIFKNQDSKSKRPPYSLPPRPFLVSFLSFILPGLGQFYNKEYKKTFIFFVSILFSLGLSIYYLGTRLNFIFTAVFSVLEMYMLSDAYLTACQKRGIFLNNDFCRRVYSWISGILIGAAVVIIIVFNIFFFTLRIAGDMFNLGLKRGDEVLVKRGYYFRNTPKSGDLIVTRAPFLNIGKITDVKDDIIEVKMYGMWVNQVSIGEVKKGGKVIFIYSPIDRRRWLR